ncbi:hypothetical protein C1646_755001 [Rhizophagus diaphanus]|nr:hypothetical protein C1646_755001 [Rhizophagus diaphanus] [Rhizophagus sp. MUCL 43196]
MSVGSGQKAFYLEAEVELYKWTGQNLVDYPASIKRYKLALWWHTKVSQKLPEETEELLEKFCSN